MNGPHPIDDLFKNKLADYELAPPMHLWDAVAATQQRPKVVWWLKNKTWILVSGVILLFLLACFYFLRSTEKPDIQFFPIELDNRTAARETPETKSASVASLSDQKNTDSSFADAINSAQSKAATSRDKTRPIASKSTNKSELARQNKATQNQGYRASNGNSTVPALANDAGKVDATATHFQAEELMNKEKANKLPLDSLASTASSDINEVATNLEERATAFLATKNTSLALDDQAYEIDPIIALRKGTGLRFFLEAAAGLSSSQSSLSTISNEHEELMRFYEQAFDQQVALTASLRIGAIHRSGISLRSGIEYTALKASFEFRDRNAMIDQIFDANGGLIRTDTFYIANGQEWTSTNRYELINIPVLLGYEHRFQRWTISVSAGVGLNIALNRSGRYINEKFRAIDMNSREADQVFQDHIGISWHAGLGLQYEFAPGLSVLIEPQLIIRPDSFNQPSFPIQQRFSNYNLLIGLRKLL